MTKLTFKDAESFLEYVSQYGSTELREKQGIIAVVLDARSAFGAVEAVKLRADGIQTAYLKVAGENGGLNTMAETAGLGERLFVGDAVVWVPLAYEAANPFAALDTRAGWLGLIAAKIDRVIDTEQSSPTIVSRYT